MAIVALSGCNLYFGGDDMPPCAAVGAPSDPGPGWRNPVNAECESYGNYPCDYACGPCADIAIAPPDMGYCSSECTGLAEDTCHATTGCYAAYDVGPTAQGTRVYDGCWQTAPSDPYQFECAGADAYECSRHDDCSMTYSTVNGKTSFVACVDEPATAPTYCLSENDCGSGESCDMTTCYPPPGCDTNNPNTGCPAVCYGVCVPDVPPSCTAVLCGPGYHCEEHCSPGGGPNGPVMGWCEPACVPDINGCSLLDCGPGYECVESCELAGNGTYWCDSTCFPANHGDPGSCYGDVLCDAIPPACPSGTTAGRANGCWTGFCIPNTACGPNDPGECHGAVSCFANPPACPAGTTPGVSAGCWTGYCIPDHACEVPLCETLSSEAACDARMDCTPVYTGTGCTCTANGCTCATLTYNRCQAL